MGAFDKQTATGKALADNILKALGVNPDNIPPIRLRDISSLGLIAKSKNMTNNEREILGDTFSAYICGHNPDLACEKCFSYTKLVIDKEISKL